ncbi:hypothetical protein HPB50_027308 [Hyalomma asiaticum]|uniref:Uncharacterized protein n=1 Tax=Hyalomma asiaticum TaxID=266040 RepID=A0ACB7SCQ7_HYAAI|nr:hypothetical protein HPB50_027308 [Hyalomma asiaticum]
MNECRRHGLGDHDRATAWHQEGMVWSGGGMMQTHAQVAPPLGKVRKQPTSHAKTEMGGGLRLKDEEVGKRESGRRRAGGGRKKKKKDGARGGGGRVQSGGGLWYSRLTRMLSRWKSWLALFQSDCLASRTGSSGVSIPAAAAPSLRATTMETTGHHSARANNTWGTHHTHTHSRAESTTAAAHKHTHCAERRKLVAQ